jgi:hypothetical protein
MKIICCSLLSHLLQPLGPISPSLAAKWTVKITCSDPVFVYRIVQLYNGIQYSEIFTLAVYVVRRFEGPNATEQRIGQLSGLLVTPPPPPH